jgi:large subunit ribosomal protein L9
MKVILRSDRKGLGKRGDIVEVAEGHARNYLLPKGHAIVATDGAVDQAKAMRRARDLRDAADREGAQAIAAKLVATPITIKVKAGAEGRLFGSVTSADVVDAIVAQTSISLDRRKVTVDHIKSTGTHSATAKLHSDVEFPITLEIVAK